MEQFLDDKSIYVIDLGHIDTPPEIIFELSSILDKEEAKNKKICLKLGNVNLNQSQLLSIKSLISGIGSILSSVDTKSVETEKVALSLGIIISNASAENTSDVEPSTPYKTVEELKEEIDNSKQAQSINDTDESSEIIEEETAVEAEHQSESDIIEISEEKIAEEEAKKADNKESDIISQDINKKEESVETKETENNPAYENKQSNEIPNVEAKPETDVKETADELTENKSESVKDELDVIFGSNPVEESIFENAVPPNLNENNDGLEDIIVPEQEYTKEDIELESFPTKYIKQTIRSGQVINYEGNLVIIGDCHPGCEIAAFGDITIWGVLSGIAHAGAGGNQKARVRALKMNAIQLRIADCYSRRPDSMNTVYIEKTDSFTPEEARIVNGEIVVFKIND